MENAADGLSAAERATIDGNLKAATGGAAPHHAMQLIAEIVGAAAGEAHAQAAVEAAMALAPRDPLEGMLVAQMAAVHAAAMRALRRAAECTDWPQIEARYLREAARLLHLFVRQAEALDRRGRRLGPGRDPAAGDAPPAAAGPGDGGDPLAGTDPEGRAILEQCLAALRADMEANRRAREQAAEGAAEEGAVEGLDAWGDPGCGGWDAPRRCGPGP